MAQLQSHLAEFATLLAFDPGNDTELTAWIAAVRASEPPHLHSFANGLELDRAAADAALTTPHHNGRTEGVNTRIKRIMRQMHLHLPWPMLCLEAAPTAAPRATTDSAVAQDALPGLVRVDSSVVLAVAAGPQEPQRTVVPTPTDRPADTTLESESRSDPEPARGDDPSDVRARGAMA